MKHREIYNLEKKLDVLFSAKEQKNEVLIEHYIKNIVENTGINFETFVNMIRETVDKNETIAQLKYRIIGDMQSRGLGTSFIL